MFLFFIPLVIGLPLFAFWVWMLFDMANNPGIPNTSPLIFTWPPTAKDQWLLAFVVLNVFAAGYYYFTLHRNRL